MCSYSLVQIDSLFIRIVTEYCSLDDCDNYLVDRSVRRKLSPYADSNTRGYW